MDLVTFPRFDPDTMTIMEYVQALDEAYDAAEAAGDLTAPVEDAAEAQAWAIEDDFIAADIAAERGHFKAIW